MSEIVGKIGPLRYRMGGECGDIFEVDDDYDGLTLTVEVRDEAEGRRLIDALRSAVERPDPLGEALQAIMDRPGFGTGRAFRDRKAQENEALALLPDPAWMAPVMASTDCATNWMICSFGNSNEDNCDWYLVADSRRGSNLADMEFPDDAKMDALRVAAILNAYRMGLLVRKELGS